MHAMKQSRASALEAVLIDLISMAKNVWKKHWKLFLFSSFASRFTKKWLKNLNNDIHTNDPSSKYNLKQIADA